MTFGRTEVCPPTDVSDRLADVLEIRRAGATDAHTFPPISNVDSTTRLILPPMPTKI